LKQQDVLAEIRYTLPKLVYAPVVFTCALSGYNVKLLYSAIAEVRAQMSIKVSTAMVNRILEDAEHRYSAPIKGTKAFKIYYGTMIKNPPPTIEKTGQRRKSPIKTDNGRERIFAILSTFIKRL
jgi:predicted GTPase